MILAIIIILAGLKLVKRNINLVTESIVEAGMAGQEEQGDGVQ